MKRPPAPAPITTASNVCSADVIVILLGSRVRGQYERGQAERGLCDEVEHHLPADRGGAHQPGHEPQLREPVLVREAVSAMGLDRLIQRLESCFGCRELGDVRCFAGGLTRVELLGGQRGGQAAQLDGDVALGQRMGDA